MFMIVLVEWFQHIFMFMICCRWVFLAYVILCLWEVIVGGSSLCWHPCEVFLKFQNFLVDAITSISQYVIFQLVISDMAFDYWRFFSYYIGKYVSLFMDDTCRGIWIIMVVGKCWMSCEVMLWLFYTLYHVFLYGYVTYGRNITLCGL